MNTEKKIKDLQENLLLTIKTIDFIIKNNPDIKAPNNADFNNMLNDIKSEEY